MKSIFIISLAIVQIFAVPIHDDNHHLSKRQVNWGVNQNGGFVTGTHTINTPNNQWTGTGTVNQGFKPPQTTVGGGVTWTNTPTGINAGVTGQHTFGQPGTNVGATVNVPVVTRPNSNVVINGQYQQNVGGPPGNNKPTFGVGTTWNFGK